MKKLYTVFDKKSALYSAPFAEITDGTAIRAMQDVMKNKDHPFAAYPADYELISLADFDEHTGEIVVHKPIQLISMENLLGE
jgi:hypothetical protein